MYVSIHIRYIETKVKIEVKRQTLRNGKLA